MSTSTQIEGNLEDYSFSRNGDAIVVSETSNPQNSTATPDNSQVEFNDGSTVEISSTLDNAIAATHSSADESPNLTTLSDGGYVLTWTSQGEFNGIHVQRYSASGELLQTSIITADEADDPFVTALIDGKFMLAWATEGESSSSIYTQEFDANGAKSGNQIQVATSTTRELEDAKVTLLDNGQYIVTWGEYRDTTATTAIGSTLDWNDGEEDGRYDVFIGDLKGRIYNNGSAGSPVTLYTGSAAAGEADDLSILPKDGGGFWMSWSVEKVTGEDEWGNSEYTTDYYVQSFAANGSKTPETNAQLLHSVDGYYAYASYFSITPITDGYAVSWVADSDSARDIYVQHYDSTFTALGDAVRVTDDSSSINGASITALADGGYLLTWATYTGGGGDEIYAQRFNADGTPQDDNAILVATLSGEWNMDTPVATALADGSFVVSWETIDPSVTFHDPNENEEVTDSNLYAQHFNAEGEPVGSVLTTITGDDGHNSLTWTGTEDVILQGEEGDDSLQGGAGNDLLDGGAGNDTARFSGDSQNYSLSLNAAGKLQVSTGEQTDTLDAIEQIQFADGSIAIDDGSLALESDSQINAETPDITTLADGSQVVAWTQDGELKLQFYRDGAWGETLSPGIEYERGSLSISPLGDGFILTWGDYEGDAFYAQRYDANGQSTGEAIALSPENTGRIVDDISATQLNNGSFVLAWTEETPDLWIPDEFGEGGEYIEGTGQAYVQLFNADGSTDGAAVRVDTGITGNLQAFEPSVSALQNGGFVVVWEYVNDATESEEVYLQRFKADGSTDGAAIRVNTGTTGDQGDPEVVTLADGSFVVTWTREIFSDDELESTESCNIFQQRFSATGTKLGAETQVNSISSIYNDPAITALQGGGYVITWATSDEREAYNGASNLYAQIFDKNGVKVGGELIVASSADQDYFPSVSASDDGGFLVAWEASERTEDWGAGSGDIHVKRFDANGNSLTLIGDEGDNALAWTANSGVTLDGGVGDDSLSGGNGNDSLVGGDGSDTLDGGEGNDMMAGGAGDDIYVLDNTKDSIKEDADAGQDTVRSSLNWTLAANLENLTLTGSTALNGTGNELHNKLIGNGAINTLTGGAGNDTLDGKGGVDKLIGGIGDDTYIVDFTATGTLQDSITELANTATYNGGIDTVELRGTSTNVTAVTLTAAANTENLDISATGASKLNLTGNTAGNELIGNAFGNILDGKTGADEMQGGLGDDTYIVDNLNDLVVENTDAGIDLLKIAIATTGGTYALADNVENAILTSTVAFNLQGNDLDNQLTGNAAANTLSGGDGNDTLDGKAGADILIGGEGSDIYLVDNIGDVAQEEGDAMDIDEIKSTISFDLGSKGSNIENLTLLGSAVINATGNALNNTLIGNAGANILDGGAGADHMDGGKGNDTYVIDNAGDVVIEGLTNAQGGGIDTVKSHINYTLDNLDGSNLDNLTLVGTGDIYAIGNALANTLTGNSGNNALDGKGGIDKLIGGAGNDTYHVDLTTAGKLQDSITELADKVGYVGGVDSIVLHGFSSNTTASTLTVGAYLENLDVSDTGTSKLNLTGNTGNNELIGNAVDNTLNGGAGADTLLGGDGNDTLIGGAGADILDGGAGNDIFRFAAIGDLGLGNAQDVIQHFTSGDKLDFKALSGYSFVGTIDDTADFTAAKQVGYRVDGEDLILYGNSGGDLNADFSIKLIGVTELTGSDFLFS